ncbi:MAG: TonB family protein [Bacteroidales bacterium]
MDKNKYKGIIGTVLFHTAILLLLLFLGFSTPLPLPGEEGVEVNLGTNLEGSGTVQPEKPVIERKTPPPPKPQPEEVKEEIATQDIEPAPSIKETETEKPVEKVIEETKQKEIVKEEPKVNPNALYKGKSKEAKVEGEGITDNEGDQGKPTGSADSKNYIGTGGFGNGPSASLSGRVPTFLPSPSKNFQENGTVVVQITVDKYGKVVTAIAIDKGSNTTNSGLRRLAEEAAKKAVFNANMSAAEIQRGTITYHFVVKN